MEPIAIVGMGCLFPGATNPDQYWQNLLNKVDSSSQLSSEELGGIEAAKYYDEQKGTPDKICYNKNGHVRDFHFDPNGYLVPTEQLDQLDNLYQWTLYVAHEALKDARLNLGQPNTGMILGNIGMPTHSCKQIMSQFYNKALEPYIRELLGDDRFRFQPYWDAKSLATINLSTASQNAVVAAQALGLNGPCFTLDAACSSAIYAIKVASDYLNLGKADVMLAGSICHADHIYIDHGFNVLQAFPGIGEQSIPFDKHSKGLKAGEGAGIVALMRLSDAEQKNCRIYGVIDAIGLSNDAGAKHILVPDFDGQVLALNRAYKDKSPQIDYLECHATGTPVGDQVELNSIESFFFAQQAAEHQKTPLLGANKGNIGHMLTASGMASLLKVLLAMKHNTIPGTIQLQHMVATQQGKLALDDVVRETMPWPTSGRKKRAGINAFGFGGVNGHMAIHEYSKGELSSPAINHPRINNHHKQGQPISITGMAVTMASTQNISDFNAVVQNNRQVFAALPATRWSGLHSRDDIIGPFGLPCVPKGAYIEKFDFDCKRFKLPPNVAGTHLLSHMSLMKLAERAFKDAGYTLNNQQRNIAVIVAGDNDYNCYRYQARNEAAWQVRDSLLKSGITLTESQIRQLETIVKDSLFPEPYAEGITGGIGNVVASRISACLKLNGPAFSLCSQENSVFKAIELAEFMLTLGEVEAVIVGSGSFCGGLENVLFGHVDYPVNTGNLSISFESEANGRNLGEGGGVVVLHRRDVAKTLKKRIYANINAIALCQSQTKDSLQYQPQAQVVAEVAKASLQRAGLTAHDIAYVEAHAGGFAQEDAAEVAGLATVYSSLSAAGDRKVVGSVKANYGHLGPASGIASLIKTALCLYQRYLPGTPNWQQPKTSLGWDRLNMDVIPDSRDWPLMDNMTSRYAAINSMGLDHTYAHLILQEPEDENRKVEVQVEDEAESKNNALIKTVYIGRETSIPDMIVNEQNRRYFSGHAASQRALKGEADKAQPTVASKRARSTYFDLAATPINNSMTLQQRQILRNSQTHLSYLKVEQQFYRRLSQLATLNALPAGAAVGTDGSYSAEHHLRTPVAHHRQASSPLISTKQPTILPPTGRQVANVVFDEQQLVEMTDGKVSNVLGPDYAEADTYPIRTRMPSPPYMFVSRVTKLTAKPGELKPCVVEWEYDLQPNDWFVYHGLVPEFISLESSHAMIIAFTKIGCDQLFKGELRYRAIDSQTTVFSDMPKAGEVLKGRVAIKSFIKVGRNVLIAYEYDGFVGDRHSFKLTANSGFFPIESIQQSKGVNTTKIFANAKPQQTKFTPVLTCKKNHFSNQDIIAVQQGDLDTCFGPGYGKTVVPGLFAPASQMVDRIISVDSQGGPWQLGTITAERGIDPDHWAFKAHFKNDPVMPGTFIVEGCQQVLKFYLYYLGLHSQKQLRPTLIDNHQYSAKFRGEVKCVPDKLRYRLTVKHIAADYLANSTSLKEVTLVFIAEVIYRNSVIGICDNLGTRLVRAC